MTALYQTGRPARHFPPPFRFCCPARPAPLRLILPAGLLCAVSLAALASHAAARGQPLLYLALTGLGLAWLASGWLIRRQYHSQPAGTLLWTRGQWHWQSHNGSQTALRPILVLDLQHHLLLQCRPPFGSPAHHGQPAWLWLCASMDSAHWPALRRALHFSQRSGEPH